MKTAFRWRTIRLALVTALWVTVSSASAADQWEYSFDPSGSVYEEEDPNGNGGPGDLTGESDGSGSSGSSAWLDLWADAVAEAWADVEAQYNQSPVRGIGWGMGYGYVTGCITWTGPAGHGGNKTCDFTAYARGAADGETNAFDLTSGGYASASADSESGGLAESDGASGYGAATFGESCSYTSSSGLSLSGSSYGDATRVTGTGTPSASGSASWSDSQGTRTSAWWSVSLSGTITNITGGSVSGRCYAEAEADVEAYADPGTICYWTEASADADAWASADVSMDLY